MFSFFEETKKNNSIQKPMNKQPNRRPQQQQTSSFNTIKTVLRDTLPNGIKSKLIGTQGNQTLELFLPKDVMVVTNPGSLLYMRGNLQKSKLKVNSLTSSFFRSLSGETITLSEYRGLPRSDQTGSTSNSTRTHSTAYEGGYITLGLPYIGDIVCVEIPKGKVFKFTKGAFLAGTSNLDITGNLDIKQFLPVGTDQVFVGIVEHRENSTGPGYIWLSTYGTFETIHLQKGDEIIIDNGMYLGSDADYPYTISRLGVSFFGSILGGEGWGMHFKAVNKPMTIYTQTKSIKELIFMIRALSGSKRGGSSKKTKKTKSKK